MDEKLLDAIDLVCLNCGSSDDDCVKCSVRKICDDNRKITQREFEDYLKANGRENEWSKDFFLSTEVRKGQLVEAIKNGYDLCDYDRWQKLQDVLFGSDIDTLDWGTSQKIIHLLYEKDIEVLDLWSFKDNQ